MKRISMFLIALVLLAGCGSTTSQTSVEASVPNGFKEVTSDNIGMLISATTIQHEATGCYYVMADTTNGVSITQMFVDKFDSSVPYCE